MAEVRYVSTSIQLHIQPFQSDVERLNMGARWEEWLEEFKEEVQLQKVNDVADKILCLKRYGGKEVRKLLKHLPDLEAEADEDEYARLKRKLNGHFIPKKNKQHSIYIFNKQSLTRRRHSAAMLQDCEKRQSIASSAISGTTEYLSTSYKR